MSETRPFSPLTQDLGVCVLTSMQPPEIKFAADRLSAIDPWKTLRFSPESMQNYLMKPDPALGRSTLHCDDGLAGVVCVRYPWLLGPYLELLAVWPDFQHRGIGRAVVEWMERQSAGGSMNLWVMVSSFNENGRQFYTRQGFVEIATLKDFIQTGLDEILMRKHPKRRHA